MSVRVPNLSLLGNLTSATQRPQLDPMEVQPVVQEPVPLREQELRFKMVCLLIANGESQEATARKVGCSLEWVRKIISAPVGMDMIVKMQQDSNPDHNSRLKKMAGIALDAQTRLLLSQTTPAAVLAKVSNDVVDRAHGKATQVTESRVFNFDLKDAKKVDDAIKASEEKLARIEALQKKLSLPVGRSE